MIDEDRAKFRLLLEQVNRPGSSAILINRNRVFDRNQSGQAAHLLNFPCCRAEARLAKHNNKLSTARICLREN